MKSIDSVAALKKAIAELEIQQSEQKNLIMVQLSKAKERLKPVNLIKSSVGRVFRSPNFISGILLSAAAIAIPFFLKKKFPRLNLSFLRKIAGSFLKMGGNLFFSELF